MFGITMKKSRAVESIALFVFALLSVVFAAMWLSEHTKINDGLKTPLTQPVDWDSFCNAGDYNKPYKNVTTLPERGNVTNFALYYDGIHSDSLYDLCLTVNSEVVKYDDTGDKFRPTIMGIFEREQAHAAYRTRWQHTLVLVATIFYGISISLGIAGVAAGAFGFVQAKRLSSLGQHLLFWCFVPAALTISLVSLWVVANDYNMREYNSTVVGNPLSDTYKKLNTDRARHNYEFYAFWNMFLPLLGLACHLVTHNGPDHDGEGIIFTAIKGAIGTSGKPGRKRRGIKDCAV